MRRLHHLKPGKWPGASWCGGSSLLAPASHAGQRQQCSVSSRSPLRSKRVRAWVTGREFINAPFAGRRNQLRDLSEIAEPRRLLRGLYRHILRGGSPSCLHRPPPDRQGNPLGREARYAPEPLPQGPHRQPQAHARDAHARLWLRSASFGGGGKAAGVPDIDLRVQERRARQGVLRLCGRDGASLRPARRRVSSTAASTTRIPRSSRIA